MKLGRLIARPLLGFCLTFVLALSLVSQATEANVVHGIDASVTSREENLLGYTVTEHYSVFRGQDKSHSVAEMTVKTTYEKNKGKSYEILNQSGSEIILKQVLARVLDSERIATEPANRATALINSANYSMHVKGNEIVGGRACLALAIEPRRKGQYLFQGDLWVDAQDGSIVQLSGYTAKSPSVFAGPTQVSRQYAIIDSFPMATHASATSQSWLFGQTTIVIEYTGYQIERRPTASAESR
jgi:hypothetical protein